MSLPEGYKLAPGEKPPPKKSTPWTLKNPPTLHHAMFGGLRVVVASNLPLSAHFVSCDPLPDVLETDLDV